MTPERWQQIEELFHTVSAHPAAERAAFLDRACAGDDSLRAEVERLLASHDEAGSFIKAPAFQVAAGMIADEGAQAMIGQTIGHYKILSLIGAGGMGEVYLAQDTSLGRKVALKLLTAYSKEQDIVRRFQQEARAASALSHPNIAHIYEIGEAAGTNFIAMEYIEGQSLSERIGGRPLEAAQILNIGIQVADALDEAHAKGITHRDIKSANVMVTARDAVKVLDFGLAKLSSQAAAGEQTPDSEVATRVKTRPGVVMGTVSNMSPEQALGRELDHRTDIFSLGVVLYEMATGRLPFRGDSVTETIDQIAHAQPEAIARFNYDVPAELESIIKKALRKARDERYQTARDLLVDLKSLKEDLQFEEKQQRSTPLDASGSVASRSAGHDGMRVTNEQVIGSSEIAAARPTSSAEYVMSGIKRHRLLALVTLVMLAAGVIGLAAYFHARNTEVAIESIAVLPFTNQSHDPDSEYLSDGISESIINSLSQLPNLRVLARSTVFRYKGRETDPLAVGRELGVRAVLTGRLIQRGDNLTISTELLDVRDNKQVWGEQYERKISDLMSLQRDIAGRITSTLRLTISGEAHNRMMKHYTENPEAYELYLKGRYFWNKRSAESTRKSIECFNQAIEKDPHYALAYASLADSYVIAASYSVLPPKEAMPKAKAAAMRALEIDDTLGQAHATLASILDGYEWNWSASEDEFRRALELDPNYATAHQWYGEHLRCVGRFDESLKEVRRAQELDPLSLIANKEVATTLIFLHRYDEAITQLHKTLEIDSTFMPAYIDLGAAYIEKKMYPEAIAALDQGLSVERDNTFAMSALVYAYAASGKRDEALKVLDRMKELSSQRYVAPTHLASAYAGLGEKEQAFQLLEKAYEQHDDGLIYLKVATQFDSLRSDPRFADLVRRVGLPS